MSDQERRRWLIIAHSFNVDGRAASQTVTDKIPFLIERGIEPVVISAATGHRDRRFPHYQRMPWGPSGIRFDFRHIMQRRFGKGALYRLATLLVSILLAPFIAVERLLFGVSNQASWFLPASVLGTRLVRQGGFELVYSSGGAAAAHHAAAVIKRKTGLRWIAEIHDPMVIRDTPADDGTRPRRTRNARYLQRLERRICQQADLVWWFTPAAHEYALTRNPALGDKGFWVLAGANPPVVSERHEYGDSLSLEHFGAVTDDRSLAPLVEALSDLALEDDRWNSVRVHAWGSAIDANTRRLLDERACHHFVVSHDRLPRADAVRQMFRADCLLLLHGDYEWCAEYIPSKLYDYLWTRRPIFAITNRNARLDHLLTQYGAYVGHTFEGQATRDALRALRADWLAQRLDGHDQPPLTVEAAVDEILRRVDAAGHPRD